ncbi:MAG: hydrogenase maturation protease [Candidatus Eisenbacteria bacterium]|nr:hydrogenase maturation protease [Candidatus Eisenbacteria bacterium]
MNAAREGVLVVGVGNLLMGDEGLGVHVARALAGMRDTLSPDVEVLEGGTALFELGPEIARRLHVILVDAIRAGGAPGTVYRVEGFGDLAGALDHAQPVSLHQWSLIDTLRAFEQLGLVPERLSVIGAEPERLEPGTSLSPALERAQERIVALLVEELGAGVGASGTEFAPRSFRV